MTGLRMSFVWSESGELTFRLVSVALGISVCLATMAWVVGRDEPMRTESSPVSQASVAADPLADSHKTLAVLATVRTRTRSGQPLVPVGASPAASAAVSPRPVESLAPDTLVGRISGVLAIGGVRRVVIDGDSFGVGESPDGQARIVSISDEWLVVQRPGVGTRRISLTND